MWISFSYQLILPKIWRATKCFNYIFKQAFSVCDRKVGLKSKQLQLFNIKLTLQAGCNTWNYDWQMVQINHTLALQEEILSCSYRFLGVLESWCLSIYRKSPIRYSICYIIMNNTEIVFFISIATQNWIGHITSLSQFKDTKFYWQEQFR